ncbi:MAG: phosphate uptake regulator PhoU [Methanomassiliicoccaceae archaeon]|nr:phosphate uptake regulator PhoU [Methanomassiliicoccaceae archaeon]
MDVRRVQITGGSSFMITLPKEWANSVGLNKNDTVGVQSQPDGSLTLYPKGNAPVPKRCTKTIDATKIKDRGFLNRQLIGAYIAGHTSMLITTEHPIPSAVSGAIANFVQTAIGLEIVEADDTHVLISDLLEHKAIEPKKTIERMKLLIKGMIHDMYEAAYTGNLDIIADMKSRDVEIDRIYWLIARQCNICQKSLSTSSRLGLPLPELTACLSLTRILEVIGDHIIVVSKYLMKMSENDCTFTKIDRDTYDYGMKAIELLTNAVKSWVDKDMELAEKMVKESDLIMEMTCKASKTAVLTDCLSITPRDLVLFSAKRLSEYCKLIAETSFNVAME